METDERSFQPSATYRLKGDGDDLERFDPETAALQLPQPERRVTRVLNSIVGAAWEKIEERHPEIIVSLSGQGPGGRELETAAVATAVARPSNDVSVARWGGEAVGAPVLIVGTETGQVLLYEPGSHTYVQEAETQATLVPFENEDVGPSPIHEASAICLREPNTSCRVVVAAGRRRIPRGAEGEDGDEADEAETEEDDPRVAVVEVYPSDCEDGPRLQLVATIETSDCARAVVLSRDGRWLAVASSENITLYRLPEVQPEASAPLVIIDEEAVDEESKEAPEPQAACVAAFVIPSSGAIPTLHWVFATGEEATSLIEVRSDTHVVTKHGLAGTEDGGAPPVYASWQMAANVSASCLAEDGDGTNSILALGLASGTVLLWDLNIDMCREVLKRHEKAVSALAVHRHKYLIAGAADGRVHIYDLAAAPDLNVRLVAVRCDLAAPVAHLSCLQDTALAVARDGEGVLALYDLARSALLGRLALGSGDRDDRAPAVGTGSGADAVNSCAEIKISRRIRVDLHAIGVMSPRWRGGEGLTALLIQHGKSTANSLVDAHRSSRRSKTPCTSGRPTTWCSSSVPASTRPRGPSRTR